jgi:hypothetical protein
MGRQAFGARDRKGHLAESVYKTLEGGVSFAFNVQVSEQV